jgi:hypothetical protein
MLLTQPAAITSRTRLFLFAGCSLPARKTLTSIDAAATNPTWVNPRSGSPGSVFSRMAADTNGANPAAICCTEALMLRKLPRTRGKALAVIIAITGTIRPEVAIMNSVVPKSGPSINAVAQTKLRASPIQRLSGAVDTPHVTDPIRSSVIYPSLKRSASRSDLVA